MNDAVAEKLVQKVINMLEEMSDLNIQVRRLTPSQEAFNRINERIDAILGAIKQIENGISLDKKRLAALDEQTQSANLTLAVLYELMEKLTKKADEINRNTYAVKENAIAANSSNESRFQKNESRFKQLEDYLNKWFREHKIALIALAVAQVVFFIVILLR
jgi:predicted  nucleic acid-binding Zn-ribbon protein